MLFQFPLNRSCCCWRVCACVSCTYVCLRVCKPACACVRFLWKRGQTTSVQPLCNSHFFARSPSDRVTVVPKVSLWRDCCWHSACRLGPTTQHPRPGSSGDDLMSFVQPLEWHDDPHQWRRIFAPGARASKRICSTRILTTCTHVLQAAAHASYQRRSQQGRSRDSNRGRLFVKSAANCTIRTNDPAESGWAWDGTRTGADPGPRPCASL